MFQGVANSPASVVLRRRGSGGSPSPAGYYVSSIGDDANPGTLGAPLQTVAAALVKATATPKTIYLRGGDTFFETVTDIPSGSEGSPQRITSYGTGRATISAGVQVQTWTLVDAGINLWSAPLSGTSYYPRAVWVAGFRCSRARLSTGLPSGTTYNSTGYDTSGSADPGFLSSYTNQGDLEIVIRHEWMESRLPVVSVVGNQITIEAAAWAAFNDNLADFNGPANRVGTSFVENAGEILVANARGATFYHNRATDTLYLIPPAWVLDPNDWTVIAAGGEELVTLDGVSDVTFANVAFAHTNNLQPMQTGGFVARQSGTSSLAANFLDSAYMRIPPRAVLVNDCTRVRFEGCLVQHIGASGITIEGVSEDCGIVGCIADDIGVNAIQIGRPGSTTSGTCPVGTVIENNVLQRCGVDLAAAVAYIQWYATGTSLQHNEGRLLPYTIFSVGWGWGLKVPNGNTGNVTAYNRAWSGCQTLSDGAAFYSNSVNTGHQIHHNYASDLGSPNQTTGVYGFYLDDGSRYNDLSNNVVLRCYTGGPYKSNNNIGDNTGTNNKSDAGGFTVQIGGLHQTDNTIEAITEVGLTAALLAGAALGAGLESEYAPTLAEADAMLDFWRLGPNTTLQFLAAAEFLGGQFADGAQIEPMPDYSNLGNGMSQAAAGRRFIYAAAGAGSAPSIQSAATKEANRSPLPFSGEFSFVCVAKTNAPSASQLLISNGDLNTDGFGYFLNAGNRTILCGSRGSNISGAVSSGREVVVTGYYGGAWYMFVNGAEQTFSVNSGFNSPTAVSGLGHPSVSWQGEIEYAGYYSPGMPPAEAAALSRAIMARLGL